MYKKMVFTVIDSVLLGRRVKPIQEAIRRVLYRYGVRDERVDRRISGIVYNVFRLQGLLEYIVDKEVGAAIRDKNIKTLLMIAVYVNLFDEKMSGSMKKTFNRYLIKYMYTRSKPGEYLDYAREYIKRLQRRDKWSPSNNIEEIMYKYRVSSELYDAIVKAFQQLGEDPAEFLEYTLKPPPRIFRVNTLKASRMAILKYLGDLGLNVEAGRYSDRAIRVYDRLHREIIRFIESGILIPQDESSMVAVELLDPKPGSTIADLCAAPGGKTTYLAEYTGLKSRIHSFEIFRDRAKRLRKLLERTGTGSVVKVYVEDARRAPEILGGDSVDYVLLDPPCTSTGALARNPDVRWRFKWSDLWKLTTLQKELLEASWRILRRGGRLMYTVCSVLPWEGEYVIREFMEKHSDARLVSLNKPFTPSPLLPGSMRAYPHRHGVIGFYYALLSKK